MVVQLVEEDVVTILVGELVVIGALVVVTTVVVELVDSEIGFTDTAELVVV